MLADLSAPAGWAIAIAIIGAWYVGKEWFYDHTESGRRFTKRRAERPDVECPACHHHQARRVTSGQRVRSGVAGGIMFSRRARAQFQCGNCGYLW